MSTTFRSFLFSSLVLPAVLGAALPASAQVQTTGPSLDPTKARSPYNPPTAVSGSSTLRLGNGYGGGYWGGGYYGGFPYYGGGYGGGYGGFYGPGNFTVIGGYPYGYGGVVSFPNYGFGYSLTPQAPMISRGVPAYFTLPLNKAGDGRRTRVVVPGEERETNRPLELGTIYRGTNESSSGDFYLSKSKPKTSAPSSIPSGKATDALGGRLHVQKAEGDLYLVEWTGPADTRGVTFRALGADEKAVSRKELTSTPFRGLLSVPERTRLVELEVRSQDGVTASLRLPVERFRAMDANYKSTPATITPATITPILEKPAPSKK